MLGRRIAAIVLAGTLALGLFGCAKSPEKGGKDPFFAFTDDAGQRVELKKEPEKVAALFSSYADIWQLAGGSVAVSVGESIERGITGEETPVVDAGAGKSIDAELLLSYEPDFVICSADLAGQMEAAEILRQAGIPVAAFRVESFSDYLRVLKICTDITAKSEAYENSGASVAKQIESVIHSAQKKAEQQGAKRILFVRAGSTYSATKAKTAENHFACQMLEELGTQNIAEQADALLEGLSLEEILLQDPDYIFISTMGDEQAAKQYMQDLFANPEWQALEAVKQGRYAFLPKELFHFKPNAKWGQAYAYLAELLYE